MNVTEKACSWDVAATNQSTNVTDNTSDAIVSRLQYLLLVFYPVFLFICTTGNVMNIFVLRTAKHSQCTTTFLIALAVGDLLAVWMQLPRYIWEINPDIFSNPKYTYAHINYYTQGWYIWMQLMWFDFSNWILIAFSVERVRALFDPLSYRGPPAAKRAFIVIGFVFVYAALSNMYRMVMQYYLMATRDIPTFLKDSVNAFITGAPNWLQTWNDVNMYYKDIEVIVVFLILLICNICIIRRIFRHRQKISFCPTITSTDRKRAGGSTVDFGCVNILLATVLTYVIGLFPLTVTDVLGKLSNYPLCLFQFTYASNILNYPNCVLMLVPYTINFYLYVGFCCTFRNQTRAVLTETKARMETWLSARGMGACCRRCPEVGKRALASLKIRESADAPMIILERDRELLSKTANGAKVVQLKQDAELSECNVTEVTNVRL